MAQGITRRRLLVAGGAGIGLVVAWAVWPRDYAVTLVAAPGETVMGAWLKIARDGSVTVAVPQAEHGQGVWTTLPQIVADELGADWRTVGVEAAPPGPLYANPLAADTIFAGAPGVPVRIRREHDVRTSTMLTAGSASIRMFEGDLRRAGAAARVLLIREAARRLGVAETECEAADGFVVAGTRRLRFGDLAEGAAGGDLPVDLPLRFGGEGRLTGTSAPRLDTPAKVDGSAVFAGDVRLPDMVFASIRQGPPGDTRLVRIDRAAADRVPGALSVVQTDRWVAAIATTWWAANRAADALAPRFATHGTVDDTGISAALTRALAADGHNAVTQGEAALLSGGRMLRAEYRAALGVHAAPQTPTATAHRHGDRLELWLSTQAPVAARDAAARACGLSPEQVTVHPMLVGGGFGAALEHDVAAQAAVIASETKRPVQLTWSRLEDLTRDRFRAPAAARMTARLAGNGAILGWHAAIAAPASGAELAARLMPGDLAWRAARALPGDADMAAIAGAVPPYRIPGIVVDHHPADLALPTGYLSGGAHGYTAFFTEAFLDELAERSASEPLSFRIGMLGGNPRLARCLSTAAALGGWDGGVPGSGQGIACHMMAGSAIAVLAEAHVDEGQRIRIDRLVAAVDCGRQINPDIVRQNIEGALLFGMAQALGASASIVRGLPDARRLGALGLPRLADAPDITVELIASEAEPGGVSELGIPAVAPAIANALHAATGVRLRSLPLRIGG